LDPAPTATAATAIATTSTYRIPPIVTESSISTASSSDLVTVLLAEKVPVLHVRLENHDDARDSLQAFMYEQKSTSSTTTTTTTKTATTSAPCPYSLEVGNISTATRTSLPPPVTPRNHDDSIPISPPRAVVSFLPLQLAAAAAAAAAVTNAAHGTRAPTFIRRNRRNHCGQKSRHHHHHHHLHDTIALSATGQGEGSSSSSPKSRGIVTFDCVRVRRYAIILGDNPSCSFGPPIQCGWEILTEKDGDDSNNNNHHYCNEMDGTNHDGGGGSIIDSSKQRATTTTTVTTTETIYDIDEYENYIRRRYRQRFSTYLLPTGIQLPMHAVVSSSRRFLLNADQRYRLLIRSGYTDEEICHVEKEMHKIRQQRNVSGTLSQIPLFPQAEAVTHSLGRKMQRCWNGWNSNSSGSHRDVIIKESK
jgi:hypothetical protein